MDKLIMRIEEKFPHLSKGQKRIARYITENYQSAAFMTAAKLGEEVGVSESTVVRFATELGYEGYPKLQKAIKELIRTKLTSVQRMEITQNQIDTENVVKSVLASDINKIKSTIESLDQNSFKEIIDKILQAKNIYILGVRSSFALASFFGFYMNLLFDNVRVISTSSASEMFEQILRISKGDTIIGISFPRYSKRTIKALQYAKSKEANVIAITDIESSPLCEVSNYSLLANSGTNYFVDSLVAPLSVINALLVALGVRKKDDVVDVLNQLENIWDEYQVYDKDIDNNDE